MKHAQPSVRRAVVDALGRMKHPRASELLSGALDDEDATVRLAAVNALAYLGQPQRGTKTTGFDAHRPGYGCAPRGSEGFKQIAPHGGIELQGVLSDAVIAER